MVEDLEGLLLLGSLAGVDVGARGGGAGGGAISSIVIGDSEKADDGREEGEAVEALGG